MSEPKTPYIAAGRTKTKTRSAAPSPSAPRGRRPPITGTVLATFFGAIAQAPGRLDLTLVKLAGQNWSLELSLAPPPPAPTPPATGDNGEDDGGKDDPEPGAGQTVFDPGTDAGQPVVIEAKGPTLVSVIVSARRRPDWRRLIG